MRANQSVPEDALAIETTRRLIRFERARIDASRYDKSGGLPSLDMLFSYVNAQEGEYRAKFESYNSMYNINSALMLTISIPTLLLAGAANIDEDDWKFRVIIYMLATASGGFILSLQLTMSWVTSGVTFIADDLDALAFTSTYYPAAIGAPYVVGVLLMTVSIIFFICDLLISTDIVDRYVITTLFLMLIYGTFTNPTYEWAYIFKKLINPPQIFWDAGPDPSKPKHTFLGAVEHTPGGSNPTAHSKAPKGKLLFTADKSVAEYNTKFDRVTRMFKPTAEWRPLFSDGERLGRAKGNAADGDTADSGKDWVSVNDKCKLVVRGALKDEEKQGFTTNLQDKLDYMRQYYDVPAMSIEPDIVIVQGGAQWLLSKVFTNGSAVLDNPAYVTWLFTWQLKPEWAAKLEGHIPSESIPLRKKRSGFGDAGRPHTVVNPVDPQELGGFGDAGADSSDSERAVRRTTWSEIYDDAFDDGHRVGWSKAQIMDKLRGITPAEFSGMTFANRLLALEELEIDDPAVRVKICNKIGGIGVHDSSAAAPEEAPEQRRGAPAEAAAAVPQDYLGPLGFEI